MVAGGKKVVWGVGWVGIRAVVSGSQSSAIWDKRLYDSIQSYVGVSKQAQIRQSVVFGTTFLSNSSQ